MSERNLGHLIGRMRESVDGLSQRERTLLTALAATIFALGLGLGAYFIYDRIDTIDEQNQAMQKALTDIEKKRGPYLAARARMAALEARVGQTPLQLSGFLETAAKDTGLEIRETNPRTPEPLGKKYVHQSVDLRISKVSLEPLLKFMKRLETYPGNLVQVTQVSVRSRDDKHQEFEVDMTVSTYEHAPKVPEKKGKADKPETGAGAEKESL